MFFDDWTGIGRVLIVAGIAYVSLIFLLQASGKRTLAKMTAFDFIVTVAVGSILANIILSKDTVFVEGMIAFVVLIGAQYTISSFSSRSKKFERLVKPEPTLLMYRGQFLHETMHNERVTDADILAAIRQRGLSSVENVEAVVFEADGSIDIITGADQASGSSLKNVVNYPSESQEIATGSPSRS